MVPAAASLPPRSNKQRSLSPLARMKSILTRLHRKRFSFAWKSWNDFSTLHLVPEHFPRSCRITDVYSPLWCDDLLVLAITTYWATPRIIETETEASCIVGFKMQGNARLEPMHSLLSPSNAILQTQCLSAWKAFQTDIVLATWPPWPHVKAMAVLVNTRCYGAESEQEHQKSPRK